MEDKIKLILSEIIYNELDLKRVEEKLINSGVPNKEIDNPKNYKICSKYFFLMNDINFEQLNSDEQNTLNNYMQNIDTLDQNSYNNFFTFLDSIKLKLLLPKTELKYLYWGGNNFQHMAPSDSIVLGLHFLKYSDNEEKTNEIESTVVDIGNYIQYELAPSKNLKVSVILFNELLKDHVY